MHPRGPKIASRELRAPSGHEASQGRPREAQTLPEPIEFQCWLPFRLFASDGVLKPQDGLRSPKGAPRGAHKSSKAVSKAPKSVPRGSQEATSRAPEWGGGLRTFTFLIDGLQDGSKMVPRPPRGSQVTPKMAPKAPELTQRGPKMTPRGSQGEKKRESLYG